MSILDRDELEGITHVIDIQIKKLDEQQLTLPASLLRIVNLDLQMRIHGISKDEIDVLSFAAHLIEQNREGQGETLSKPNEQICAEQK